MFWPDPNFGPIHLWNFPKQQRDYAMDYTAERRKSNRMKLKPTKRPGVNSQIIVEPARGIGHSVEIERILKCRDWRASR